MYRRRASNVEPSLSTLSQSPVASQSVIVGGGDLSSGFCVSVGRHSRGISLSLRPQQQQQERSSPVMEQQRPLVSVVIPTADASSLRQRSPSNSSIINIRDSVEPSVAGAEYRTVMSDDQPSRFTIYQPLLATGRTSSQQLYDLPRRHSLLTPSPSPSGLSVCLSVRPSSVCMSLSESVCLPVSVLWTCP